MIEVLIIMAITPVIMLCSYIYRKDANKEPMSLLMKIFFLGFIMSIPVIIVEWMLGSFFEIDGVTNFIQLFISIFISVALIEEGAKWLVVKFVGYNNKEFDEIYDIIVYSAFSSLGFACIENILYVLSRGGGVAFGRAILSVPGHMCFGIIMGYFFSKAKLNSLNNSKDSFDKNMFLSIIAPTTVHTIYDALLFYTGNISGNIALITFGLFIVFDIIMVIVSLRIVKTISSMQTHISNSLTSGVITNTNGQIVVQNTNKAEINFCPVCGRNVRGSNFCGGCGYKIK